MGTTTADSTGTGATSSQQLQSTLYSLPLEASWEPDLWGKVRNTVRQAQYAAQVSAADLENERLTEQASLAEFFFEIRGQDQLQKIYDDTVEADQKAYELTRALYEAGIDDQISVVEAETTLQSAQAGATNVGIARAQYEHAIAVLIGKAASNFSIPVKPMTVAPPPIPVGVPSELLERRPDVAAAERTMAGANAAIGIAYAAYYPNLTLTGAGGFESSAFHNWLSWPSRFWSVGASIPETIFDAGLRRATVQQYVSTYNADLASYRQTVLGAFQQVEDSLAEVRILSKEIQQEQQAVESAQIYLKLEKARYETGVDPYVRRADCPDHSAIGPADSECSSGATDDLRCGIGRGPRRRLGSFAIAEYAASDAEADQVGESHRAVRLRTSGTVALAIRLEGEDIC